MHDSPRLLPGACARTSTPAPPLWLPCLMSRTAPVGSPCTDMDTEARSSWVTWPSSQGPCVLSPCPAEPPRWDLDPHPEVGRAGALPGDGSSSQGQSWEGSTALICAHGSPGSRRKPRLSVSSSLYSHRVPALLSLPINCNHRSTSGHSPGPVQGTAFSSSQDGQLPVWGAAVEQKLPSGQRLHGMGGGGAVTPRPEGHRLSTDTGLQVIWMQASSEKRGGLPEDPRNTPSFTPTWPKGDG